MLGHKLTLKVKVNEVQLGELRANQIESEVLLDGKKLNLVQKLCFMIDANNLVPVVVLTLIPGEVEIEFDGEADVAKVMSEINKSMFTLDPPKDIPCPTPPQLPDMAAFNAMRRAYEEQFGEIPKCPQD